MQVSFNLLATCFIVVDILNLTSIPYQSIIFGVVVRSNSSGGLQIEASKTYLHAHLQKIEAQD
jgi:hypothetical protein